MKILEAKNITKMFPGVIALDSVDVAFEPGEIHAIIGENGAGKSTLIKCLTGVYEPEEGEVMISGENAMKNKALFDKVAYVPQEIDLFGYMSVAENLFIFHMLCMEVPDSVRKSTEQQFITEFVRLITILICHWLVEEV